MRRPCLRNDQNLNLVISAGLALLASLAVACGGASAGTGQGLTPTTPGAGTESCSAARPDFGAPATAADRALFSYNANAPLDLQQTVESTQNGVQFSGISYTSPDGGPVPGILVEPIGRSTPRPGLVVLHPSGLKARDMGNYAKDVAKHGAVVIAIDAPYWRRGGPFLLITPQDRTEQIQLMKDLQRAVDVLRAHPNVDPQRIGFEGYSYGGIMGAQFVGIERRLKAAVLAAAHGGWVTHVTSANNQNFATLPCDTRTAWLQAMVPIEPIRYIGNAAPASLLFQIAQSDTAVLLADAQALADAASNPKDIRYYNTGHSLNQQAMNDRHDWWHAQLGIDARGTW